MGEDRYGATDEGAEYIGMYNFWFVAVPVVIVMLGACWVSN
jgi:hypothetical protein